MSPTGIPGQGATCRLCRAEAGSWGGAGAAEDRGQTRTMSARGWHCGWGAMQAFGQAEARLLAWSREGG